MGKNFPNRDIYLLGIITLQHSDDSDGVRFSKNAHDAFPGAYQVMPMRAEKCNISVTDSSIEPATSDSCSVRPTASNKTILR